MPAHTASRVVGRVRRRCWQSVALPLKTDASGHLSRTKAYGLSGLGRIRQQLTVLGSGANRPVLAFDLSCLAIGPVAATRSGDDGFYTLSWLNPSRDYLIMGLDDQGQYGAAVSAPVRPVVP